MKEASGDVAREAWNAGVTIRVLAIFVSPVYAERARNREKRDK